jgi:hypothetical protein
MGRRTESVLVGKPEGNRPHGKSRPKADDNIIC